MKLFFSYRTLSSAYDVRRIQIALNYEKYNIVNRDMN